jgi:hypothetical protein
VGRFCDLLGRGRAGTRLAPAGTYKKKANNTDGHLAQNNLECETANTKWSR